MRRKPIKSDTEAIQTTEVMAVRGEVPLLRHGSGMSPYVPNLTPHVCSAFD
jgi:hypothetical protein